MSTPFNYRHLHYFWVVAKEGGMARAAARLGMAVQTVSAQVRELERSLGHALLKPAGRLLVVDWAPRETPKGPPQEVRVTAEALAALLRDAGFADIVIDETTLPWHLMATATRPDA